MEDTNNLQLNNQAKTNNEFSGMPFISNHSQEQQGEIEEKKYSSKYNILILFT